MTKLIDIHMIDSGKFPDLANAQRKKMMEHPLVQFQEGEFVHLNLREARLRSYSKGTCPYVSFIDDDDEVLDISWLEQAIDILEKNPDVSAVYPRYETWEFGKHARTLPFEARWNENIHRQLPPVAHHLTIMRRENVMAIHEMFKVHPVMTRMQEPLLTLGMLRFGRLVPLDVIAYRWIVRPDSMRITNDNGSVTLWSRNFIRETYELYSR